MRDLSKFTVPREMGFSFAMDRHATATTLRQIATDIETGVLAVQEARLLQEASQYDYQITTLVLSYAIKDKPEPPPIRLNEIDLANLAEALDQQGDAKGDGGQ